MRDDLPMTEDILSSLQIVHVSNVELGTYYFAIDGWIPQEWFTDLRDIVEEVSDSRVAVVWEEETPVVTTQPVLLRSRRFLRPFQQLVELFSLPGTAGFDPSFLTFVTLPLFAGFMLGDYGYGLVLVLAGLLLRRYYTTPMMELASALMLYGGLWAIVFGTVVFADFFGFQVPIFGFHLLDRLQDVPTLLSLSVIIGLIHINIGLVAGFIYGRRRVGLRVAFLRRLSWLIAEAGGILLVLSLFGFVLTLLWIPALAITSVGIALVTLGGGVVALVEIPRFVTAVLSYLRLGIIAIAKGSLGVAINSMILGQLLPSGFGGWAVAGMLLVVSHGTIMFLALFIIGLHALRLHYVEFYSQFYDLAEMGQEVKFEPSVKLEVPEEAGD
ncbi:MAG: V-type ATPase 116kDa subunit family protein [Thermoplasmata archaeon]